MVLGALLHPSRSHPAGERYRARIDQRPIVISFVTVTELRYGALKANWGELRRRGLERELDEIQRSEIATLIEQLGGERFTEAAESWQRAVLAALDKTKLTEQAKQHLDACRLYDWST